MVWGKTENWRKILWYQPHFSQHFIVCDVWTWRSAIPHLSDLFRAICNLVYKTSPFLGRNTSHCRAHPALGRFCGSSDPVWFTHWCLFFHLLYQLERWNSEFLEMSKTPERAGRGFEALGCFWGKMVQSNFFLMLFYLLLSHYDGCWAGSEAQTSHNCTQWSGEDFYQIKFLVFSLCLLLL